MWWVEWSKKEVYVNERININEIFCTEFVDCYYYLHNFSNQMVFNDLFYLNLHFWEDSPMIISSLGFW